MTRSPRNNNRHPVSQTVDATQKDISVSGGPAGIEVSSGTRAGFERGQRPDRPYRGQVPVLDMSVHDNSFPAACAGNGRGSSMCLQAALECTTF
jgi:hypothetical protein